MSDNEQDEEMISGFESVDELQSQGINVQDINKLKAAGICTVLSVSQTTRRNLLKIKGLSEAKVEKLKEAAAKMLPPTFATAAEIGLRREACVMITTGSKTVDAMLGGGIQTGSLTEVFGEYRTGKTQLAHTMAITTQLPQEMGGGGGKVAWIDTEGTFRPERLTSICDRFGVDATAATGNVICGRAFSSEQQHDMLFELAQRFVEDRTFKLLVIDSVMNLFRSDFSGRGELSERQQRLNAFLSRLAKMAEEFVQADPGATAIFAGPSAKPIGGHILAHASATRIQLRKGRGEERIAKLVDSPCQPDGESTYALRVGGWEDV